jgi:hypothetical protein
MYYRPHGYSYPTPTWHHSNEQEYFPHTSGASIAYERNKRTISSNYSYPLQAEADQVSSPNAPQAFSAFHSPVMNGQRLGSASYDHRRSHSLTGDQSLRSRIEWEMERRKLMESNGNADYSAVRSESITPPSPSSQQLHPASTSRNEDVEKLSFLRRLSSHGSLMPPSLTSSATSGSSRSSVTGMRTRVGGGGADEFKIQLPSISKLPCSSDRSTSTLTPITPLEDYDSPSEQRTLEALSSLRNNGRTLPPLQGGQRRQPRQW